MAWEGGTRIRLAGRQDIDQVRALIGAMGGHGDGRGARRLGMVIARGDCRALVAERDGRVVGYLELHARPSTLYDQVEGWVAAVAIAEDCRGRGIGHALMAAAEREAALLGCSELALESALQRDRAHDFYRGLGFEEASVARRFRRAIAGPAAGADLTDRFLRAAAAAADAAMAVVAGVEDRPAEGKELDRLAEMAAIGHLAPLGLPIVGEEGGFDRGEAGRAGSSGEPWIALDPLDGTRNWRADYAPWAVSIGLVRDGSPIAGMVVDVPRGRRWWAAEGRGAYADGRRVRSAEGGLVALPSWSPGRSLPRLPAWARRVRVSGSTAVELCRVADGSLSAFAGVGGTIYPQDLAAAGAVLLEAGATLLGVDGLPVELVPDPALEMEVVAAATPEAAAALLGCVAAKPD